MIDPKAVLLFLIYQTPNRSNGGAESITQVLEHMSESSCILLTNRESNRTIRWKDADHRIIIAPWFHAEPLTWLRSNWNVYRISRRTNATILHANDIISLMASGLGARLAGLKVIFNVRDTKTQGHYDLKWRLARILSHRILCLSQEMKQLLDQRLPSAGPFKEQSIDFIYSIVDLQRMHPVSSEERARLGKELGISESEFCIALVAAVMPKKQQLTLLENIPEAWHLQPDWKFHCVGDFNPEEDSYAALCQKTVERRSLQERVEFHGFTETVERWYQAADVILVASEREGLARCMIESLACGTPVVSFDVCSAREILEENQCGLVCPQGDYPALFQSLKTLQDDPRQRKAMGRRGAAFARKTFAPEKIVDQYREFYQGCLR